MDRKAQGISVNVIIMIVIGLLVLAIIAAIVINVTSKGEKDLRACENLGGECLINCPDGQPQISLGSCPAAQECCRKAAEST